MATSLVSTGLQFPDSTIQTTAATAGGGSIEAVASGSLANGDLVVINTDGTVSVVAQNATPSFGSQVTFTSNYTTVIQSVYDSTNQKIVVIYTDISNSNYGTAVVGTVSGSSITFGSPVVFSSSSVSSSSITFDSVNGKVVIAYRNNSLSTGQAVVGTVSGTSISFGSATTFLGGSQPTYCTVTYHPPSGNIYLAYQEGATAYVKSNILIVSGTSLSVGTQYTVAAVSGTYVSSTYDAASGNVVVAWRDGDNLGYGTARVGSISGAAITYGSSVVFATTPVTYTLQTYDSDAQKVIIAYRDATNIIGKAVVGTVSGTSISFGTPVTFQNSNVTDPSITYVPTTQTTFFFFRNSATGGGGYVTYVTGTVSGTSMSFAASQAINALSSENLSSVYDSTNQKLVVSFTNLTATNAGDSIVGSPTSTNLTSENYIGISNGAYSDAATATIQVAGAVDDAQTGLTPGQSYYVQPDGTLSTTAGTPSVFAGTAVASTKIIVKG